LEDKEYSFHRDRWLVVQKFRAIGDAIFHMHAFHAIAAIAPRKCITLAIPNLDPVADLFIDDPAIENIIKIGRRTTGRLKNVSLLAKEHFARGWLLGGSRSYAYTFLLAGIKERLAYGDGWLQRQALTRSLYRPMAFPLPTKVAEKSWSFLEAHKIPRLPDGQKPVFSAHRLQCVFQQYAHLPRPWIAFGIGASALERHWPSACWSALAESLFQQCGAGTLFLCGGWQDLVSARQIAAMLHPGATVAYVIGEHLSTVAGLFHHADLFVGNDSGLFNLAGAINASPVVGLFGVSPVLTYLPHIIPVVPQEGMTLSMGSLTPTYVLETILNRCQITLNNAKQ
jgi:ADP-heptose:LPS heptosyltransferase